MPHTPVAMLKPAPGDNDPSWRPSVKAPTESPRCAYHPVSTSTLPRARSLERHASNRALRRSRSLRGTLTGATCFSDHVLTSAQV